MTVARRLITAGDIVTAQNPTFRYKVLAREGDYVTVEIHSYRDDGRLWKDDGDIKVFDNIEVNTLTLVE